MCTVIRLLFRESGKTRQGLVVWRERDNLAIAIAAKKPLCYGPGVEHVVLKVQFQEEMRVG